MTSYYLIFPADGDIFITKIIYMIIQLVISFLSKKCVC